MRKPPKNKRLCKVCQRIEICDFCDDHERRVCIFCMDADHRKLWHDRVKELLEAK